MAFPLDALLALTPRAQPNYKRAFRVADDVFPRFGLTTDLRVAHFLAQVLHETRGLEVMVENLNYRAERLLQVWPSRFPTHAAAQRYAGQPRQLANKVYGGRNGNLGPDDGWTYIGRGLLQITGRANYERVSQVLGVSYVAVPDLVNDPAHALRVAACLWQLLEANAGADRDDVVLVTRRINGGRNGLDDRRAWLQKTKRVFGCE